MSPVEPLLKRTFSIVCNYFSIDTMLFYIAFFHFIYHSETDQLYKICTVLGTPDCTVWPEGMNLPRSNTFKFFQVKLNYHLGSLDVMFEALIVFFLTDSSKKLVGAYS
jgi:hypothetical protein